MPFNPNPIRELSLISIPTLWPFFDHNNVKFHFLDRGKLLRTYGRSIFHLKLYSAKVLCLKFYLHTFSDIPFPAFILLSISESHSISFLGISKLYIPNVSDFLTPSFPNSHNSLIPFSFKFFIFSFSYLSVSGEHFDISEFIPVVFTNTFCQSVFYSFGFPAHPFPDPL